MADLNKQYDAVNDLRRSLEAQKPVKISREDLGLDSDATTAKVSSVTEESRLSRLEGSYDALKVVRPMTITVAGIILAGLALGFTVLISQMNATNARLDRAEAAATARADRIEAKVDAIPGLLRDEFRALRAETAAQTSAIANSITAARQMQPSVTQMPPPPSPTTSPN